MEEKKTPDIKKAPEAKNTPEIKKSVNTSGAGQKPTQAKAQKKKKKISAGALISIVLIIAIAGVFAAVYFDIGGAKQIAASLLKLEATASADGTGGTDNTAEQSQLDKREETLKQKEQELSKKEDELKTKEDELNTKDQDLTQRETTVKDAEKKVGEEQDKYYTSVSQIYEKMDVKKAAKAISGLTSPQEMAKVLLYMTKDQAGKVLDQINSALATQILSEMMK